MPFDETPGGTVVRSERSYENNKCPVINSSFTLTLYQTDKIAGHPAAIVTAAGVERVHLRHCTQRSSDGLISNDAVAQMQDTLRCNASPHSEDWEGKTLRQPLYP